MGIDLRQKLQAICSQREEALLALAYIALLILVYSLYRQGLSGPLLLDDFWNLRPLGEDGGIDSMDKLRQFLFSNSSGPTGRPVSMASFLIDAQDWPPRVASLKYTNVLIHLLTGTMVFWFGFLLSQLLGFSRGHSGQVALLLAALWMLNPLNVSTVLYVVQRMTQLMTLFGLAALNCYLMARSLLPTRPKASALFLFLCLFPFGLLSVLSKENGALLLAMIVLMESLFFSKQQATRLFKLWYRVGVMLPLAIVVIYLLFSGPENIAMYDMRYFNLTERLLSETRILTTYIWKILLPNVVDNGLYHDNILLSTSLFSPITTFFSSMFILALLGTAIYWRKDYTVYSFAVFWFFVLHFLESSYLPLELYFEHRNYFPMIGPLFAVAYYLRSYFSKQREAHLQQTVVLVFGALLGLSTWLTGATASTWGDALRLNSSWAEEKPDSIRAQTTFADYLNVIGMPDLAMEQLEIAHSYYPNEVTVQLYIWNQACAYGLQSPLTLEEIAESRKLEYYRDDINNHLQILIENKVAGTCSFPEDQILVQLFERIGELPLPDARRAGYHVFFSDLYVIFGMLDPALINLSRAFELNTVPQIPIRQAILAASAGEFESALVFLERAKQAELTNSPLLPSTDEEISRLEADFRRRL